MVVLLDTDICIHLINRRPGFERVVRRLSGRSLGEICISAITVSELRYGVTKSAKSRLPSRVKCWSTEPYSGVPSS